MSTLPPKPPPFVPSLYAVHVKVFNPHPNPRSRESNYLFDPHISKITFLHPTLLLANCHARHVALFGNENNSFLPTAEQIREGEEATAKLRSDRDFRVILTGNGERERSRSSGSSRDGNEEEGRDGCSDEERVGFYKLGWDKEGCVYIDVEFESVKISLDRYTSQPGNSGRSSRHYFRREPVRKVLAYVKRLDLDDGRTPMAPAVRNNLYRCMPVDWVGEPLGNKWKKDTGEPDVIARLFSKDENVKTRIIKGEPIDDTLLGKSSKRTFTTITRGIQTMPVRNISIAPVLSQKREFCSVGVQTNPVHISHIRQFSSISVQANWTPAAPIRQSSSVGIQVNLLRNSKKLDPAEVDPPHPAAGLPALGSVNSKPRANIREFGTMTGAAETPLSNASSKPEHTQTNKRKLYQQKATDQYQNKSKQSATNTPVRNNVESTSTQIFVTSQPSSSPSFPPVKSTSASTKKSTDLIVQESPSKRQKLDFTTKPIPLESTASITSGTITGQQVDNKQLTSILSSQLRELNKYLFNLHPILAESSNLLLSQEEDITAKEAHILHRENMLKQKEVQVIAGKEWLEIGKSDLKMEREKFEQEVRAWKEKREE